MNYKLCHTMNISEGSASMIDITTYVLNGSLRAVWNGRKRKVTLPLIFWLNRYIAIMTSSALIKPQSHQIVRFVDRTIGCDLVSYDRSAMFAAISFTIACCGLFFTIGCRSYVNLHDNYVLYLLASIKQVYCK